ncbi:MAG: HTTM domain-containing protein [Pirellulales bacterium]
MKPWTWLVKRFDAFLFQGCDVPMAAVVRIGYAILLIIHVLVWLPDAGFWFSNEGVLQTETAQELFPRRWSIFYCLPSTAVVVQTCMLILMGHAILLLFGIGGRLQSLAIFLWLTSIHHRNPIICDGEDTVMRLFAFFMIFLPLDASASPLPWNRSSSKDSRRAWALRLFQIEMTLIYASTAWCKAWGETWQQGTAFYYVSQMTDVYGRPWLPDATFGSLWVAMFFTYAALLLEIALPIALWIPKTRKWAVAAGILLHLAIELTMNLFLFEWVMMLGLLTFLRWDEFKALVPGWRRWDKNPANLGADGLTGQAANLG